MSPSGIHKEVCNCTPFKPKFFCKSILHFSWRLFSFFENSKQGSFLWICKVKPRLLCCWIVKIFSPRFSIKFQGSWKNKNNKWRKAKIGQLWNEFPYLLKVFLNSKCFPCQWKLNAFLPQGWGGGEVAIFKLLQYSQTSVSAPVNVKTMGKGEEGAGGETGLGRCRHLIDFLICPFLEDLFCPIF